MAKRTPASGAPKAAATPAAAPTQTRSVSSMGTPPYRCPSFAKGVARRTPQQAPIWIIGPSLPKARPAPTQSASATTFASSVSARKDMGRAKPATIAFTSGMPLPRAAMQRCVTKEASSAKRPVPAT